MNTYNDSNRRDKSKRFMMKGLLAAAVLMAPAFSFMSCSDDLTDETAKTEVDRYMLMKGYTQEQIKMQRLGYGYDAAGNVMDDSSFTATPIVNMNLVRDAEQKYGVIVSSERRHYTTVDIFSGCTIEEVGHEETKYTINENELVASGKYYRKNETTYKGTWHSNYLAHMFVKHIMATTTIDVGMLHCMKLDSLNHAENPLSAEFRKDLAELVKGNVQGVTEQKATAFSEKYGTHLVVSSNLGGMCELQMCINRDSCVDKEYATEQVSEVVLGTKVTKTTSSQVIKELPQHQLQYQGEIKVKGGSKTYTDDLHRTYDHKSDKEVKISDGKYYEWAGSISTDPGSYNAAFTGGRYLPFYQLFENTTTRQVLRKVYELYLKKEAPTPEVEEAPYGILPIQGNYGPDVRVASIGKEKAAILCEEYVPSIRSDKPCVVAYPLIRDTEGTVSPYFYSGLFVGDESHRPGRVIWVGSASRYIPSDSIYAESDSTHISNLFDQKTHQLKNVYFYWNAVHPQPCPTLTDAPGEYKTAVYTLQPKALAKPTTFAKVASTFWSVRPVQLTTDNMYNYWKDDKSFEAFAKERHKDNKGLIYQNGDYYFCLIDGGQNFQRGKEFTDDNNGNKRWTDAVSMSMKALGLEGYLPSVIQSKSITKMLGNRMSVFYERVGDGQRNMLGLDWPSGYWVISHPQQKLAATPTQNDKMGMPILTDDARQARILRLSNSGTDMLLDYPEYVRAFNYSDQDYFKFFPIYITTNNFGKYKE